MQINQTVTAAESYSISTEIGQISTINERVYEYIKRVRIASRNEIQRRLELTARQASCSTWHLIQQGKIRLTGQTVIDQITRREVETLEVNPQPEIIFKKVSDKEKLKKITNVLEDWMEFDTAYDLKEEILQIINS